MWIDKIEDIQYSTEASAYEYQVDMRKEVCQSEVRHLLKELKSWREESNRKFNTIIDFHTDKINKGINDFAEEVSSLQSKLSRITRERDDLLDGIGKLSRENRQLKAVINIVKPVKPKYDRKEKYSQDSQTSSDETDIEEHNLKDDNSADEENHLDNQPDVKDSRFSKYAEAFDVEIKREHEEEEVTDEGDIVHHEEIIDEGDLHESEQNEVLQGGGNQESMDQSYYSKSETSEMKSFKGMKLLNKCKLNKKQLCEQCPYETSNKSRLQQHCKEVHGNIKDHKCKKCGYAASRKSSLNRHKKSVHKI